MGTKAKAAFQSIWAILWRSGLFFLTWGLLLAPFTVPLRPRLAEWERAFPHRVKLYGDLVGALAMLAASWLMIRLIDRRPFLTIGLRFTHLLRDLLLGLAVGSAWLAISVGSAWAAGWLLLQPNVAVAWSNLVGEAISVFFNVLTQQLLLCGYIFQTLQVRSNPVIALLTSALLFVSYHAGAFHGSWLPPVNVFAAGILFGLAYRSTGNLWFPIAIHFAWNYVLGPVLGLTVSGSNRLASGGQVFIPTGPALFIGGAFGLEGGLIVTLMTITVIIAMLLMIHQQGRWAAVTK